MNIMQLFSLYNLSLRCNKLIELKYMKLFKFIALLELVLTCSWGNLNLMNSNTTVFFPSGLNLKKTYKRVLVDAK